MTLLKFFGNFALMLCTTICLAVPNYDINFIENNLETAKQQAKAEGKLIMVDFWASWCSPCKWMDEQTFSKPEVANYLNSNYISVRVNIDNFDGMTYKQEYGIRYLPTILVVDAKGKVVKKYEESMAPSKLLRVLKELDKNKVLPAKVNRRMIQGISKPVTKNSVKIKDAPVAKFKPSTTGKSRALIGNTALSKPSTPTTNNRNSRITSANASASHKPKKERSYPTEQKIVSANTSITSNNRPLVPEKYKDIKTNYSTTNTRTNSANSDLYLPAEPGKIADIPNRNYTESNSNAVSEVGLYQLNVKKAPRHGFSVQVGAYYDYKNVLVEVAKFQKSFASEVLVHITELNHTTCYKVLLGHYTTHNEASQDKRILKELGVKDAFIKNLGQL